MAQVKTKPNRHKIVLIGPSAAGKTSIIHRYSKGNFYEGVQQPTIGTAFYAREVNVGGEHPVQVSLNIWDTAGMERFKSLVPKYAKGASAAIIVFDITDPESYTDAKSLLIDAPNSCEGDLLTFFVGNKIDCGYAIDVQDAKEFAQSQSATFMETSAKTGENVEELFLQIAERLAEKDSPGMGLDITGNQKDIPKADVDSGQSSCCK
jgi:Ras-related protein Rab-5C